MRYPHGEPTAMAQLLINGMCLFGVIIAIFGVICIIKGIREWFR